jgi:beta-mannosidase
VVESGSQTVEVSPLADNLIRSFDFSDQVNVENERDLVFVCTLMDGNEFISTSVGTFVSNKHVSFVDPGLEVTIQQNDEAFVLNIMAESMARFVQLKLDGADVVFSNNYFDVPAGQEIKITCPIPDGWTLEKAADALSIYSLYDSFA